MSTPRFLVTGHSHAVCILEALQAADGTGRFGYARLSTAGAQPERPPLFATAAILARTIPQTIARSRVSGRLILPPLKRSAQQAFNIRLVRRAVPAALGKMIGAKKKPGLLDVAKILRRENITVLAAVGGVAHNFLSLAELEPPFDFVLPAREDLGADPSKDLVPYRLVREFLQRRCERVLPILAALKKMAAERMLVIESPPPVRDNAHVRQCLARQFANRFHADLRVTSPSFRYKIWRVNSEVYEDFCRREDLAFVRAPASAIEDGMFLRPEGWRAQDAIHGNAWYGACVVEAARMRLSDAVAPRQPAAEESEGNNDGIQSVRPAA